MDFEVLHIGDCPNGEQAADRLQEAMNSTGHGDESIGFRLLLSSEDAVGTAFAGSPTITLDGIDLIPSQGATSDLACRIYMTVACHEYGTTVGGFLPGSWDHLNCQLWDHPASLAGGSSARLFDRRVRVLDVEVIGGGIQGGQCE